MTCNVAEGREPSGFAVPDGLRRSANRVTYFRTSPQFFAVPLRRSAFSLIELVIVIVLMAILAGLASIPVRSAITRSQLSHAVEMIERFDLALRTTARQQRQTVQGTIDRSKGKLTLQDPSSVRSFQLPKRVRLKSVRIAGGTAFGLITATSSGATPTYAFELVAGETTRWIVLVGGSGQVIRDADATLVTTLMGIR